MCIYIFRLLLLFLNLGTPVHFSLLTDIPFLPEAATYAKMSS